MGERKKQDDREESEREGTREGRNKRWGDTLREIYFPT